MTLDFYRPLRVGRMWYIEMQNGMWHTQNDLGLVPNEVFDTRSACVARCIILEAVRPL